MTLTAGQVTAEAAPDADRPAARAHSQRRDIQGMRALAVGLVVVYHLRPGLLPGGFVGVDVFFVISGFLIVGTLTGEVRRTGRLRLLDFYARRIRRLLPAASAVLLATVAATVLLLPISRWVEVLQEVAASALDVQNWMLALFSSDYAHATAAASPVQHFWSLSVEEQFYLVVPVVLLVSALLAARRRADGTRYALVAVAVVTIASLVFSVLFTPASHGPAYFVTPTRMWELGLGGLAAMLGRGAVLGRALRGALGWAGLAAVLASAAVFTTDLQFPGWIAVVPTMGTVALLIAGTAPDDRADDGAASWFEVRRLLGLRPITYVGDVSYSLYLWHWPVIVFLLATTDSDTLSNPQALLAAALGLALAVLSKHFVEDPFRRTRKRSTVPRRLRPTYLFGLALVLAVLAAAVVPLRIAQARIAALEAASVLDADHPGALALDPTHPSPVPAGVPLVPDPAVADHDYPLADRPGCVVYDYQKDPAAGDACTYGPRTAAKTVVLLGDSHAAQFSTALADFAASSGGWRVKVMVRNGCPFSGVPPYAGSEPLTVCSDQNRAELAAILAMRPDLVVTSAMSMQSYSHDLHWTWPSRAALVAGYADMLRPLSLAGIPVAVIRDVPRPRTPVPACLQHWGRTPGPCDTDLAAAFGSDGDPLVDAAKDLTGVRVVDLTKWLCPADMCPAVIGNVVVYRDNHLTNSYVHTLAVPLASALGIG